MKYLLHTLITLLAAGWAASALQAQSADGTRSLSRWSVQVETGGGLFHGLTTSPSMSRRYVGPTLNLGADYALRPWLRIGGEAGYMHLKWNDIEIQERISTTPNYEVNGCLATLTTRAARMDNRHRVHLYHLQAHADYDLTHLWPARKASPLHLRAGLGAGYLHARAQEEGIWAYKEEALSENDQQLTIYSHAYVEHKSRNNHWNALYLAPSLSAAYDLCPHLTLHVKAEYKLLAINHPEAPTGIATAAIGLQYRFGTRRDKTVMVRQSLELTDLHEKLNGLRSRQAMQQAENNKLKEENDSLKKSLQLLAEEKAKAPKEKAAQELVPHAVFFRANSTHISATQEHALELVAQAMQQYPDARLVVRGYASPEGDEIKNGKLSQRRAEAVARLLIRRYHIDARRIEAEGCGITDQLYETYELNRVAVVYLVR